MKVKILKAPNAQSNLFYDQGGILGGYHTNGADWDTDTRSINVGGTHEENANKGIPMGTDDNGTPNLVEEGEFIYKDYVYSNRLRVPKKYYTKKEISQLSWEQKMLKKYQGKTFAEAIRKAYKEVEENPNDNIYKRGFDVLAEVLKGVQEKQRLLQKSSLDANRIRRMSGQEILQKQLQEELAQQAQQEMQQQAIMQQEQQMQQQQMAPEQEQMMQEQMMQQQPMQTPPPPQQMPPEMQPQMAYGGRLFEEGGNISPEEAAALEQANQQIGMGAPEEMQAREPFNPQEEMSQEASQEEVQEGPQEENKDVAEMSTSELNQAIDQIMQYAKDSGNKELARAARKAKRSSREEKEDFVEEAFEEMQEEQAQQEQPMEEQQMQEAAMQEQAMQDPALMQQMAAQQGMPQQGMDPAMMQDPNMMAAMQGQQFAYGGTMNLQNPNAGNMYQGNKVYAGSVIRDIIPTIDTRTGAQRFRTNIVDPKNPTVGNYFTDEGRRIFGIKDGTIGAASNEEAHKFLFQKAIQEVTTDYATRIKELEAQSNFKEARALRNEFINKWNHVNELFDKMSSTDKVTVQELQTAFDNLGLNKYLQQILKENPDLINKNGSSYSADNFIDKVLGAVTSNRFLSWNDLDEETKTELGRMGISQQYWEELIDKKGTYGENGISNGMVSHLEANDKLKHKVYNPEYYKYEKMNSQDRALYRKKHEGKEPDKFIPVADILENPDEYQQYYPNLFDKGTLQGTGRDPNIVALKEPSSELAQGLDEHILLKDFKNLLPEKQALYDTKIVYQPIFKEDEEGFELSNQDFKQDGDQYEGDINTDYINYVPIGMEDQYYIKNGDEWLKVDKDKVKDLNLVNKESEGDFGKQINKFYYEGTPEGDEYPHAGNWPFWLGAGLQGGMLAWNMAKPIDYSNADAVLNAGQDAGKFTKIGYKPVPDYMKYNPDSKYDQQEVNKNYALAMRNILNSAGGNRGAAMAGIVGTAKGYNDARAKAAIETMRNNFEKYKGVSEFNQATNTTNANNYLAAQQANLSAEAQAKSRWLDAAKESGRMRKELEDQKAAGISANISGIADMFYNMYVNNNRNKLLKFEIDHSPSTGVTWRNTNTRKDKNKGGENNA